VRKVAIGSKGVPHIVTHDGPYDPLPGPGNQSHDTVKYDFEQGKVTDFVKFDTGNIVMINRVVVIWVGRVSLVHREKHIGGFDIVHVKRFVGPNIRHSVKPDPSF